MATRGEIIKRATAEARQSWVSYTDAQLRQIVRMMEEASAEITARIARYERAGVIQRARLAALQSEIAGEIRRLRGILGGRIERGMERSVDLGMEAGVLGMQSADLPGQYKVVVGSGYISAAGKVIHYDPARERLSASAWAKIHGRAMDHLVRFNPEGLTLSEKVWNVTWATEQSIRRSINLGVLQGKSAATISREIRQFLAEPSRLYRRVRVGGRLVLSRPARAYHPGRGVYRSSAKNAMRVARTEYQRAFHEGMVRYVFEKAWISGVIWRLGNVEACPICVELADRWFPKDKIPGIPHQQCMCHTEPTIQGEPLPAGTRIGEPDKSIVGDIYVMAAA